MLKNPLLLLDLVGRIGHFIRMELRRIGAEQGLQPVHVQALIYLSQANRFSNTPQALTEFLGSPRAPVAESAAARPARADRALSGRIDRRVVRLRLSAQGEAFMNEAQPALFWLDATRNMSANRIRSGVSALRDTLAELQANSGARTFGLCQTCGYCQRKSQRIYHCAWYGERLSIQDMRKLCREHAREVARRVG